MENKEQQTFDKSNIFCFFAGLFFVFAPILRRGISLPAELVSPINGFELISLLFMMWTLGFLVVLGFSLWESDEVEFSALNGFISGIVLGSCGFCSYYAFLIVQRFGVVWGNA